MLDLKKLLTKICSALGLYEATTTSTTYGTLYVQRVFNAVTVTFDGNSSALTHSAFNKLFTLDASARPSASIRFVAYDNVTSDATKALLMGYVSTSGECYVWVYGNSGTNVAPRFSVTFLKQGSLT